MVDLKDYGFKAVDSKTSPFVYKLRKTYSNKRLIYELGKPWCIYNKKTNIVKLILP